MRLRSLVHLVEAVKALVRPDEIAVLGSSALLAADALLGDEGQPLEISMDADLLIRPCEPGTADVLHEAVGENSLFHREYGVFADILRSDIEETLPAGWRSRAVPLQSLPGVVCLEKTDLALVKLALGRDKDLALLKALVARQTLSLNLIRERYRQTPLDERRLFDIGRRLRQL